VARSSRVAALLLAALAGTGIIRGADLCEGCWEVGGRANFFVPRSSSGTEAGLGVGAQAGYRFKPFWSAVFSLDRTPTRITDGPDETISFLTLALEYTFRSQREKTTRPFLSFVTGFAFDHVAGEDVTARTVSGPVTTRTSGASDHGLLFGIATGGFTTLTPRLYLRYEVRFQNWSAFGSSEHTKDLLVGLVYRLGS